MFSASIFSCTHGLVVKNSIGTWHTYKSIIVLSCMYTGIQENIYRTGPEGRVEMLETCGRNVSEEFPWTAEDHVWHRYTLGYTIRFCGVG